MIFNVNQNDFPSEWQKEVWKTGKCILPLEATLSDITDEETINGCTQIYDFTHEVMADMYLNPNNYNHERSPGYICAEVFTVF